jgi:hypothetical protein
MYILIRKGEIGRKKEKLVPNKSKTQLGEKNVKFESCRIISFFSMYHIILHTLEQFVLQGVKQPIPMALLGFLHPAAVRVWSFMPAALPSWFCTLVPLPFWDLWGCLTLMVPQGSFLVGTL